MPFVVFGSPIYGSIHFWQLSKRNLNLLMEIFDRFAISGKVLFFFVLGDNNLQLLGHRKVDIIKKNVEKASLLVHCPFLVLS